jgi:hypothetical protein
MQALGAGQIDKRFVDRQWLDERRELKQQPAHLASHARIFLHVRRDDGRVRTRGERLEHRHSRMHAIGAGNVAAGRDDAAFAAADNQRLVGELRIVPLLDRGIEGIAVDMRDRQCVAFGMNEKPRRAAGSAPAVAHGRGD